MQLMAHARKTLKTPFPKIVKTYEVKRVRGKANILDKITLIPPDLTCFASINL